MNESIERWRRQQTIILSVFVALVVGILGLGNFLLFVELRHARDQIQADFNQGEAVLVELRHAIESSPEQTTRALCLIFKTFDRLSEYHGFPPATDAKTRRECVRLLDG